MKTSEQPFPLFNEIEFNSQKLTQESEISVSPKKPEKSLEPKESKLTTMIEEVQTQQADDLLLNNSDIPASPKSSIMMPSPTMSKKSSSEKLISKFPFLGKTIPSSNKETQEEEIGVVEIPKEAEEQSSFNLNNVSQCSEMNFDFDQSNANPAADKTQNFGFNFNFDQSKDIVDPNGNGPEGNFEFNFDNGAKNEKLFNTTNDFTFNFGNDEGGTGKESTEGFAMDFGTEKTQEGEEGPFNFNF